MRIQEIPDGMNDRERLLRYLNQNYRDEEDLPATNDEIAESAGTNDLNNIDFGQTLGISSEYTIANIVDKEIAEYYGNSGFAPWELNTPSWEMPTYEEISDIILDDKPSLCILIIEPEINKLAADKIEDKKARQNNPELNEKW